MGYKFYIISSQVVASGVDERTLKREGVCAASLPTTMVSIYFSSNSFCFFFFLEEDLIRFCRRVYIFYYNVLLDNRYRVARGTLWN